MNLLLLDQYADPGGAQQCLLDLLPAVCQRGWRSVVAAPEGALLERARDSGAAVEPLSCGEYSSGRKSVNEMVRFARTLPGAMRTIRELAGRYQIDLLYVNGPRVVPAAVAAVGRNIPIVFHCHSFVPQPYGEMLVGRPLRWAGATVISSSKFAANSIRPITQLHIVYNGVPDCWRPAPCAASGYRIGLIGRIAPQKGHLLFVQAARIVADALRESSFEICGEPLFSDPESIRYEERVRQAALGLPIQFTGWTEDVGSTLARLDLLVVPSIAVEATTRVILEGFSAGVPVVAFATGGIPEVISDGQTGFLVAQRTPEGLAGVILKVLSRNREDLSDIAIAARKEWEARFTLERYQREITDLLDRVRAGFKASQKSSKNERRENRDQRDRGKNQRVAET